MNEEINIESLIGKYLNSSILDDERRELVSWIEQSNENEMMFNQIREIMLVSRLNDENFQFDVHTAFERVRTKIRMSRPIPRFREPKPRRVITLSYRWAAAAAILLLIGGTLLNQWIRQPAELSAAYQEIVVPLGSRNKVVLPDGSQVNLNAGSTLRYRMDYGVKSRDLWLDGEGFFDVRKSSTPFVVHSGTLQIRAVGTSFNVRAYSSDNMVETTLVSGKIEVTGTGHHRETNECMTLLPNQKLIVSNASSEVTERTEVKSNETNGLQYAVVLKEEFDPVPDISWKDNIWIIDREDLESLSVKLERRFDVDIVFADEQLKSFRYNGSLPDLSLEQVLNVMSMVSPVHFSINGKTVVFSENKKYKK